MTDKEKAAREHAEAKYNDKVTSVYNIPLDDNMRSVFRLLAEIDFLAGYNHRQPEIDQLRKQRDESLQREKIATKIISDQRKEIERLKDPLKFEK